MENSQVHELATPAQLPSRPVAFGRLARWCTLYIALAAAGIVAGVLLGWEWLAAAGLSSFIIALLPCTLMCAAGLCASRFSSKGGCHGDSGTVAPQGAVGLEKKP